MLDYVALVKPRITLMSVLMAAGGYALATRAGEWGGAVWALIGTALAVGSANALNMVIERESDALMTRTANRPLPAGRMKAAPAVIFGIVMGIAALAVLLLKTNLLTAALGAFALLGYVLVYTPLKRRTPLALLIGAVPGAMPPLMGWTAATGQPDLPGLALFMILLVWQIPHFLAIGLYRKEEYARAGIRIVPIVRGDQAAKIQSLAYTTALVPVSLCLVPLNAAGWLYFAVAAALGAWFLSMSARGLSPAAGPVWARKFFLVSLAYLPMLVLGLLADALIR